MSELSNKIKAIRGVLSAEEAGVKCGLSRESFYRVERGGSVKIETLRDIAKGFHISENEWLDLLVAWLKHEAGADAEMLFIESKRGGSKLHDHESSQVQRAMSLFTNLNPTDRAEITKAMQRTEVRACLPAINSVWEKFTPSSKIPSADQIGASALAAGVFELVDEAKTRPIQAVSPNVPIENRQASEEHPTKHTKNP
jgi:hypothetical protein